MLVSLKLEIDNEDERVRSLKAQMFETNRLIQMEKEKEKVEVEQKDIQSGLAEAKASSNQDLGELMQWEAQVDASLSQVEEKMVETELDTMRYAWCKVRFESSKIGRQTGVDFFLVEYLEKNFDQLCDQVVYRFVNDTMMVVKLEKSKDFLANQKHLADHSRLAAFSCRASTRAAVIVKDPTKRRTQHQNRYDISFLLPRNTQNMMKEEELEISGGVFLTWREVLLAPKFWVLQYSSNLLSHHPDRDVFCGVDCRHSQRIPRVGQC